LVDDRPNGTRRLYRIAPQGVAELRAYVEELWSQALANFKDAVEQGEGGTE
jgi:hypothetical protein